MRPRVCTSARISLYQLAYPLTLRWVSSTSADVRSPLSSVTMFPLQKVSFAKLPTVRRRLHPDRECLTKRSKHRKLPTKFYFHVHPVFTSILFSFVFYAQAVVIVYVLAVPIHWFIKHNAENINLSFSVTQNC